MSGWRLSFGVGPFRYSSPIQWYGTCGIKHTTPRTSQPLPGRRDCQEDAINAAIYAAQRKAAAARARLERQKRVAKRKAA